MNTTYAASDAWWETMPIMQTSGVRIIFGASRKLARISALKRPTRSATPAPNITSSTSPNGAKPVSVRGISVRSRAMLASEKSEVAVKVSMPFSSTPPSGAASPG